MTKHTSSQPCNDRVLVGIDLGTSHLKVRVFDAEGNVCGAGSAPVPMLRPSTGCYEQDSVTWWALVCELLRRIEVEHPGLLRNAAVISVCGHSHGPTPYVKGHGPLDNCITWLDQRGSEEVAWMLSAIGETAFHDEGNMVVDTCYTAAKLLWIQLHRPDIYDASDVFLLPKDVLVHRLTEVFSTDYTDVSVTNLFSSEERGWSETLIARCGLDPKKLPPVHQPWEIVGEVTPRAAQETGLREGTPVIAGAADWACLYYGAGGVRPHVVVDLAGTVGGVMVTTDDSVDLPGMPSLIPGIRNSIAGCMEASSVIYEWFIDELGPQNISETGVYRFERMNAAAKNVPPGSEGLLVLPHFAGARRPQKENSKGVILGLTLSTTRATIARAIIEGVAFETRRALERIADQGIRVELIRAIGGGARSTLWRQIKADVSGIPYCTLNQSEAGAFGAAMLGGYAVGVYPTLETPIDRLLQTENRTTPRETNGKLYDDLYRTYCRFSDGMETSGLYDDVDNFLNKHSTSRKRLAERKELES